MKKRLDILLVERELAQSREKARRFILAGSVMVDGQRVDKAGSLVKPGALIEVAPGADRYASRGGWKLEGALKAFSLNVEGKTAVDVGSSTGGFTDCLLQHGARRVYCVDVGKGLLAWKLRRDERVVVRERLNARMISPSDFDDPPELAVVDVAFISLWKVLAPLLVCLSPGAEIVALVKPQFEAGPKDVGRGGVVSDPAVHRRVLEEVTGSARDLSLRVCGLARSCLRGPAGNVEFFLYLCRGTCPGEVDALEALIRRVVEG